MNKSEAIQAAMDGAKITHEYFCRFEYIYYGEGSFRFECGMPFTLKEFFDYRGEEFLDGWSIWKG